MHEGEPCGRLTSCQIGPILDMSTALDELTQAAIQLSPRQKLVLAELLIESADAEGGVDEDAEAAWDAEIRERIRVVDEGRTAGVAYDEVMRAAVLRLRS